MFGALYGSLKLPLQLRERRQAEAFMAYQIWYPRGGTVDDASLGILVWVDAKSKEKSIRAAFPPGQIRSYQIRSDHHHICNLQLH